MKKYNEITSLNLDTTSKKEFENNSMKTTNVNILLNRVRLDQKKNFQKKLILFFIFLLIISSLTALAIL